MPPEDIPKEKHTPWSGDLLQIREQLTSSLGSLPEFEAAISAEGKTGGLGQVGFLPNPLLLTHSPSILPLPSSSAGCNIPRQENISRVPCLMFSRDATGVGLFRALLPVGEGKQTHNRRAYSRLLSSTGKLLILLLRLSAGRGADATLSLSCDSVISSLLIR
eukprot:2053849-Rhodomonas_salina.3